ncbi:tRNA methyltransferase trm5 [Grosmannia clavigera kw1407]|uniref:tRNA (guanine(37)-N1)-methyltransferase n=1 Tax=Grosmannia clavigera (strain kw1407 / UAMH 11150) TaxID=655863 RepID=F0XHC3_GROCL|nr:tRNA methyltransferase trm5 [Grosmannia clavigera kw1407]EFX03027.1 tRNA methyltransferase trm5 [Grosmannia clavigera kw1407]
MGTGQKRPRPQSSSDDVGNSSGSGTGSTSRPSSTDMAVFRPPILRSAALTATSMLKKALFTQTFDISAARIHDPRNIAKYQKALTGTRELLRTERLSSVVDDPEQEQPAPVDASGAVPKAAVKTPARRKCLLLKASVSPTSPETWSTLIKEGVERDELGVIPYKLTLNYDHWTSLEEADRRSEGDILFSVLPEEFHDDIPTGFNTAGHVAHLNLRDRFKPYKHIVAQVLLDKNPQLRTVINKIDLVGTNSAFRTFRYEVLAGPDDLEVEVRENFCTYRFNYSRVYWNSKLEPEHTRLLYLFQPGQAVVDVMAGIGPFAVPAGRRGVFVWANDMNPDSYAALVDAIQRNKVTSYVRPFNEDGLVFIRKAADLVQEASTAGEGAAEVIPPSKNGGGGGGLSKAAKAKGAPRRFITVPRTVDHFVMNLPASAITFLPKFRGLYTGSEALFGVVEGDRQPVDAGDNDNSSSTWPRLPIIHVHCFAPKNDEDDGISKREVCERVAEQLGVPMRLVMQYADVEKDNPTSRTAADENPVYVHNVRAVAPQKSMFCASFRLPATVAFAPRDE